MSVILDGSAGVTTPNVITSPSGTALTIQSAGTTAMTIDTSQNVGIGTTNPLAKFNVFGANALVSNPAGTSNDSNGFEFLTFASSTPYWSYLSYNASSHRWKYYNTEAMRIDTSGNLLVGTTSTNPSVGGFAITTGNITYGIIGHASGTGSGNYYMAFNYNGSAIGTITQNGTTGVLYNITSDYRLKNNPTKISNGVATINQLNPVNFTWKPDGTADSGFLAHEFQSVFPRSVVGEKDAVDASGNPVYQQMDNSGAIPFLVAAIQELSATITTMQSQITDLQAKLKSAGVAGF